ncbi:MAG TPA: hypothetical protein VL978_05390 [Puia sp.]|nr:hypothetical protein [Puia sp.]
MPQILTLPPRRPGRLLLETSAIFNETFPGCHTTETGISTANLTREELDILRNIATDII